MFLEYLGLITVLLSWIGGAYLLRTRRAGRYTTISKHGAADMRAKLLFGGILCVLGGLFYYWLLAWLTPELQLPLIFVILATIAIIGQITAGVVPDTTEGRKRTHRTAAAIMSALYLPLAILILFSNITPVAWFICSVLFAYMVIAFCVLSIFRRAKIAYLFFQVSYIVIFQLLILTAGYVRI